MSYAYSKGKKEKQMIKKAFGECPHCGNKKMHWEESIYQGQRISLLSCYLCGEKIDPEIINTRLAVGHGLNSKEIKNISRRVRALSERNKALTQKPISSDTLAWASDASRPRLDALLEELALVLASGQAQKPLSPQVLSEEK